MGRGEYTRKAEETQCSPACGILLSDETTGTTHTSGFLLLLLGHCNSFTKFPDGCHVGRLQRIFRGIFPQRCGRDLIVKEHSSLVHFENILQLANLFSNVRRVVRSRQWIVQSWTVALGGPHS